MGSILKISEASSIAFHSLGLLASTDEKLNVKQIAEKINASENHLSKIMQRLTKCGIIGSVRGPKGGFYLMRASDEITLLEIYEIIEGKIELGGCPLNSGGKCPFHECMFGGIAFELTKKFRDFLVSKTISSI